MTWIFAAQCERDYDASAKKWDIFPYNMLAITKMSGTPENCFLT